jgi:hypothetical protein
MRRPTPLELRSEIHSFVERLPGGVCSAIEPGFERDADSVRADRHQLADCAPRSHFQSPITADCDNPSPSSFCLSSIFSILSLRGPLIHIAIVRYTFFIVVLFVDRRSVKIARCGISKLARRISFSCQSRTLLSNLDGQS